MKFPHDAPQRKVLKRWRRSVFRSSGRATISRLSAAIRTAQRRRSRCRITPKSKARPSEPSARRQVSLEKSSCVFMSAC